MLCRGIAVLALAAGIAACGGGGAGDDDDASPGDAGVSGDAGNGPDDSFVFDRDAIRTYTLTVDAADWAWLNDNATLEQYVPATLEYAGAEYGPIGIRYKGGYGTLGTCFDGSGNRICPKLSIKLDFPEYDASIRFYGLKRLNFHSMRYDPSMMRDVLSYAMFRDMNVAAPRAGHARIVVNGEQLGVFALVEQIDGRFTHDRFAADATGDGNLYKEVWPQYTFDSPYLGALRTNEDINPDVSKMVRFATDLAGASDATIEGVLERWTDVDALMRYLAVDRAIENWDGIVGWYCPGGTCFNHNYYWYEETTRDKVWLIPWDMDNTWHVPNPIVTSFGMPEWDDTTASCGTIPLFNGIPGRAPACDPLIRWLSVALYDRYLAATEALLAGPFQLGAMSNEIDRLESLLAPHVAADGNGPGTAAWLQAVDDLRAIVQARHATTTTLVTP
jgi:hypothetical protein